MYLFYPATVITEVKYVQELSFIEPDNIEALHSTSIILSAHAHLKPVGGASNYNMFIHRV